MPHIRIDDEVWAHLRRHGRMGDTHNDTVRSLLGLPKAEPATPPKEAWMHGASMHGKLMPLIAAGMLTKGDTVTWHRLQRGETHVATVDGNGCLVTADGAVFLTPDSCATALAGYPHKGWPNWRTAAGDSLKQLRERAAAANPPGHERNATTSRHDPTP
jgi:hypothetical protein